jgi:hypothetical protein
MDFIKTVKIKGNGYLVNDELYGETGDLIHKDIELWVADGGVIGAEFTAEEIANQYQLDRKAAYPSVEDQLDDIYHNGVTGWKATIKIVKDKYPKGE